MTSKTGVGVGNVVGGIGFRQKVISSSLEKKVGKGPDVAKLFGPLRRRQKVRKTEDLSDGVAGDGLIWSTL